MCESTAIQRFFKPMFTSLLGPKVIHQFRNCWYLAFSYLPFVASALFFAVVCWGGSSTDQEGQLRKWLQTDTMEAGGAGGEEEAEFWPPSPFATGQAAELLLRVIQLRCHEDRYRQSFQLSATTPFNTSVWRRLSAFHAVMYSASFCTFILMLHIFYT